MTNNLKIATAAFVIIATAAITFGVYNRYQKLILEEEIVPLPTPVSNFPASEASPPAVQPESGTNTAQNIGIKLIEPQEGQFITSPFIVRGLANVPSGLITITVKELGGKILARSIITACMGTDFCPFEASINFTISQTPTGYIEVYNQSEDNSQQFLQRLTVSF